MNKQELCKLVEEIGLVPVIRTASEEDARFAAKEVARGGIPLIEITMTVPGAIEVIRQIASSMAEVTVGAGTVMDAETARECIDAGAQFIGSPALDVRTVELVAKNPNVIMMAGAMTPTEIETARKAGSDFVKIYPVSLIGGENYIRMLKRPFPELPLMAGGGITQLNAAQYIMAGVSALSIGKEIIPRESMLLHKPDRIRELVKRFSTILKGTRARMAEAQAQTLGVH